MIARFLAGVDYDAYREAELTRSGVERLLILIGEAVNALLRLEPSLNNRWRCPNVLTRRCLRR